MQHCNTKRLRQQILPMLFGGMLALTIIYSPPQANLTCAAETAAASNGEKLVRGHWSEKPEIMRTEHGKFLLKGMRAAAADSSRKDDNTIERCVTCHIRRDENQQPVSAADQRHFCVQCHAKESVSINCFSCHASLPASDTAVMGAEVRNADAIKAHLGQWKQYEQEKAAKGAAK